MANSFDICIRGAGIVGCSLALHLAAKRLRVALVAQPAADTTAHSDVRAYALSPASRELLQAIRCWPEETHATAVTAMQVYGATGEPVVFAAQQQNAEAMNWIVDVPQLEQQLMEAVRFQPLITRQEQPMPATLTVVCEGRSSQTRAEFGVAFETRPYHQTALAARVLCALPHGQVARQWFDDGQILALLPLDGPRGQRCALVWSLPPQRAQELQALAATAFCEQLQAASRHALGGCTLVSERKTWTLQAAQAAAWAGQNNAGSWVLAGDAAHNVHPLAGQGLNLGLGDVAALVRILDGRAYWRSVGDLRLLRAYERSRKAELAVVGGSGDALHQIFGLRHPALQALRTLGMRGFEHSGPIKQWVAQRAMGGRLPQGTH